MLRVFEIRVRATWQEAWLFAWHQHRQPMRWKKLSARGEKRELWIMRREGRYWTKTSSLPSPICHTDCTKNRTNYWLKLEFIIKFIWSRWLDFAALIFSWKLFTFLEIILHFVDGRCFEIEPSAERVTWYLRKKWLRLLIYKHTQKITRSDS